MLYLKSADFQIEFNFNFDIMPKISGWNSESAFPAVTRGFLNAEALGVMKVLIFSLVFCRLLGMATLPSRRLNQMFKGLLGFFGLVVVAKSLRGGNPEDLSQIPTIHHFEKVF